jgi:hypothetical protein
MSVFGVWFLKMVSRNWNSLLDSDYLFLRKMEIGQEIGPFGVLNPNNY